MFLCGFLKALFITQIFFGLFNEIITEEDDSDYISSEEKQDSDYISSEEKQDSVGTEDDPVPYTEMIELLDWHGSKTSVDPVLKIKFNDSGKIKIVVLNIVEDHDLIGPTTTGIWSAKHDPNAYHNVSYTPRPDIFTTIGNFHLYQNSSVGAAITMFNRHGNGYIFLVGLIENKFIVKTVPDEVSRGLEKGASEYVAPREFPNSKEDRNDDMPLRITLFKSPDLTHPFFQNSTQSASDPVVDINPTIRPVSITDDSPDVVFPKMLVSADYNSVSRYPDTESYLMEYIAYLNIADMVYRKIDEPRIRLTITGIILPEDELAAPYVAKSTGESINAKKMILRTSEYFSQETERFPSDNYNIVIVMVEDPEWTIDGHRENEIEAGGLTFIGGACYRKHNVAAVEYRKNDLSVIPFVHELGHLFNVSHDHSDASSDDCIMFRESSDSQKLCWSSDSRDALRSFFRSDSSTCMLKRPMKIPDTMKMMQGTWLSLGGQCQNKYKDTLGYCYNKLSCRYHGCSKNGLCHEGEESPMEGSIGPDGKRCIDGHWTNLEEQ